MNLNLNFVLFLHMWCLCCSQGVNNCGRTDYIETNFVTGAQNDEETNPVGRWPWMASIGYYDENRKWNHQCGATLISNNLFLTAAHCVNVAQLKVRIGDVNHASNKDDRTAIDLNILGYRVHPDFDGLTSYYDVALVQTDILMFSKSISPICLPNWSSDDVNKYDNYHVELTGWGKTRLSGRVSDKLRRVSLRIYPSRYCNATYSNATFSTRKVIEEKLPQLFRSHTLCAGAPTGSQGSCHGDSGGPLMYQDVEQDQRWSQIAIVQGAVRDCGDIDFPGIYIRVDDPSILNFIKSGIKTFGRSLDIGATDVEETKSESLQESLPTQPSPMSHYTEICGKRYVRHRKARISGGVISAYGDWPWQVSVSKYEDRQFRHKCGGTLLTNEWIITAAHCVEGVAPSNLSVRIGEYNILETNEPHQHINRRITRIITPINYNNVTKENDIALLLVDEVILFQPNIIPICLPDTDSDLDGEDGWAAGWGTLLENGNISPILRVVELTIISNFECINMFRMSGQNEWIPKIFLCTASDVVGKDFCQFDAGGPFAIKGGNGRFQVAGIMSWGIGCGEKNRPGVSTRISEFKAWIIRNTNY